MTAPLEIGQSALKGHFERISRIVRRATATHELRLDADADSSPVVAGLSGRHCEFIYSRSRKRRAVVPLLPLKDDLFAWLSLEEKWEEQSPKNRERQFSFWSVAVGIYFGCHYVTDKPRMFRAEWCGPRKLRDGSHAFPSPNAAQPHWHFDGLGHFASRLDDVPTADLSTERDPHAERFSDDPFGIQIADDSWSAIARHDFSRIHFAGAALWWQSPSPINHMHGPESAQDLEHWVEQCIGYIKSEVSGLVRRQDT